MRKGTHGTCRSRANEIIANGFSSSSAGRRGSGVYMWGYTNDKLKPQVSELACAWWNYSHKQGNYSKDSDKRCAIVDSTLHLEDDFVLDMEIQAIREKFIIYSETFLEGIESYTPKEISEVYDAFVDDLEQKLGYAFQMVHVKVQRPVKWSYKLLPDQDIAGQPSCYVVKDLTCIAVDGVEEIEL